jgi:hypothetical protein
LEGDELPWVDPIWKLDETLIGGIELDEIGLDKVEVGTVRLGTVERDEVELELEVFSTGELEVNEDEVGETGD